MGRGDLGGTELEVAGIDLSALDWSADKRGESLQSLIAYAHGLAEEARKWYSRNKKGKQDLAKALRVTAIIATSVAGIVPILTQIYKTNGSPDFAPAWASVALAVAATCIGLDRFFGFSSGWLRYIEAQTQIRNAIQVFVVDCQLEKLTWESPEPDIEQSKRLITRAKALIVEINTIVDTETKKWAGEFRDALGKLEEAAEEIEKTQAKERPGAINLTVANGADCDDGWTLSIDGGAAQKRSGTTAALANLAPGLRNLSVAGAKSGKAMQAEKTVTVAAGAAVDVELSLT